MKKADVPWAERFLSENLRPRNIVSLALAMLIVFALSVAPEPRYDSVGSVDTSEAIVASFLESWVEDEPLPDDGLYYSVYQVVKDDTVSAIAMDYGVTVDAIVTFNNISNTRALAIGRYLKIPSMPGILYTSKEGDTVNSLALSYEISPDGITEVNHLFEMELDSPLPGGIPVYLPDARMSSLALREINGDLFKWPIRGWITSRYGWRNDPFTGVRSFHTGLDIGAAHGTPVYAAMEGRVSAVGYNTVSGNYIIISHHDGYTTLYAHLSKQSVKTGAWVTQATIIGNVGSTGYSTGPHLHFTVSKYGKTMNPVLVLN